jgi:5-methylcytosine-specific restriction endonuclease McrA
MFDGLAEPQLLAEMSAAQRAERIAVARRLFAAGRLCQRRMAAVAQDERAQWCIDNWEAVAAEVGAELGISRRRASAQMNYGLELLERLPRLGAAFAAGEVEFRVIAAAVFRTGLITDPQVLNGIDSRLTRLAPSWNGLSQRRLAGVIDRWVVELDPLALRNARSAEQDRHVEFGHARDGMVEFWGALRATDAAVLEQRLTELAADAEPDDTRTLGQRRADALVALGAGGVPGSANVVVHVIADAATLDGRDEKPGHLPGYGSVPPDMLRDLATRSRLRPLTPAALLCQEPRYRPSRALADYIRCRDLHCRFPGCDQPAEYCDIDHTVPWQQGGPTHPSNLALLCRAHHLLKTFWDGENGWDERQHSDGTITWTSPSGRTYATTPSGALLFPQLGEPSGQLKISARQECSTPGRTLMMPARRRTRAEERAARIRWERSLNESRWAADPPPF